MSQYTRWPIRVGDLYPVVPTYADLPDPSTVPGRIYIVEFATGIPFVNRHEAGMYLSLGTSWSYVGLSPDTTSLQVGATIVVGAPVILEAGSNISLLPDAPNTKITISAPNAVTSASNVGTAGVGVFDAKVGNDLQFRKLNSTNARLAITLDAVNQKVDFTISTAAPIANLTPITTNSEGVANTLARSDHSHALPTAAPTTSLTSATTNSTGTGTSFSRNDHTHAITTAIPVATGDANAIGAGPGLARSNHVHETRLTNYITSNRDPNTVSSSTPERIGHFEITVAVDGLYYIHFKTEVTNDTFKSTTNFWIYVQGNEIRETRAPWPQYDWVDAHGTVNTHYIYPVRAGEVIEVWWNTDMGTSTVVEKVLTAIRINRI